MFTGIIEELGTLRRIVRGPRSASIELSARLMLEGSKLGDSIAVNGVCLTITRMASGYFCADAMYETLSRSNLGLLRAGAAVHLERAARADTRMGGHIVSGHIDGLGRVSRITQDGIAKILCISCTAELLSLMRSKGSVALDGTSLTIISVAKEGFTVGLIPHTAKHTLLAAAKIGTMINIECDMLARYALGAADLAGAAAAQSTAAKSTAAKIVDTSKNSLPARSTLSLAFLQEHGFAQGGI